MPRPATHIDIAEWARLRRHIERIFHLRVYGMLEAQHLSELIWQHTRMAVSADTVARCWSIRPSVRPTPYVVHALQQLVQVADAHASYPPAATIEALPLNSPQRVRQHILHCAQSANWVLLRNQLFELDGARWHYLPTVQLGQLMRARPDLRQRLIHLLAQTEIGRRYFFEAFVDIDHYDDYFARALDYYARYVPRVDQRHALERRIFVNGVHYFEALQRRDHKTRGHVGALLFSEHVVSELQQAYDLNRYPVARWIAARAIHQVHLGEASATQAIDRAQLQIQQLIDRWPSQSPHPRSTMLCWLIRAAEALRVPEVVHQGFDRFVQLLASEHDVRLDVDHVMAISARARLRHIEPSSELLHLAQRVHSTAIDHWPDERRIRLERRRLRALLPLRKRNN